MSRAPAEPGALFLFYETGAWPRHISRFEFELEDPVLKRSIRHAYNVIELPVRG